MKKIFLLVAAVSSFSLAYAQDLPGISSSDYAGVNGVYLNPANTLSSRYKWDVNLFGLHFGVGNNQASYSLKRLNLLFTKDSIQNLFIGKNGESTNALMQVALMGPSFQLNIGEKNAIAFTTRARTLSNATDFDGELASKLINADNNNSNLPYSINSDKNMRMSVNGWAEIGLSYAREIYNIGPHFLKGGVTVKYLAGAGNGFAQIDNLKATLNDDNDGQDTYLQNTTGRVQLGWGGINVFEIENENFRNFKNSSVGADVGFVYEYRPEEYQQNTTHPYKFKVGLSLIDMGAISYEKDPDRSGGYQFDITGAEKFYLNELDNTEVDEIKDKLDSYPQYFTPLANSGANKYKASLPTSLHLFGDIHVVKNFYVNVTTRINLINSKNNPYHSHYYTSITATPRFESKMIGVYVPLQYNALSGMNAGVAVRLGPVYMGSGSLLSAFTHRSKQVDFFMGVRFGGLL